MPNSIKYSVSAQSKALKRGNFFIGTGDDPKGHTTISDYWNGITPPNGGYTIYLNKASQGPSIYVAANDSELISLTNRIAGTSYTTASQCLSWFLTQTDKMVLNKDYESIVTDGLILNLDAGFVSSYPRTSTTWYDLSGSGNNATLFNSLNSNWNSGGYFDFDGIDDYASISYNSSMAAWATAQTIIFWEYHTFQDGTRRNFWNQAYGGAGTWTHEGGFNINYYYGNAASDNSPYTSINSSTTLPNRWNMLVTTRDTSQVNWYVNNTNVGSASNLYGTLANTTSNITIGNGYTGQPWAGRIAIIQAYNKALTATEVSQNFNAQKGRFGL
jgi:hypothetical protein